MQRIKWHREGGRWTCDMFPGTHIIDVTNTVMPDGVSFGSLHLAMTYVEASL